MTKTQCNDDHDKILCKGKGECNASASDHAHALAHTFQMLSLVVQLHLVVTRLATSSEIQSSAAQQRSDDECCQVRWYAECPTSSNCMVGRRNSRCHRNYSPQATLLSAGIRNGCTERAAVASSFHPGTSNMLESMQCTGDQDRCNCLSTNRPEERLAL